MELGGVAAAERFLWENRLQGTTFITLISPKRDDRRHGGSHTTSRRL